MREEEGLAEGKDLKSPSLHSYGEMRLPRYTSYPTAPLFSPAVEGKAYAGWLSAIPSTSPVSLYLHVPFCRSMCWYCGCHTTISARDDPIAQYLLTLRKEIEIVAAHMRARQPVTHVHLGGGTPTIMKATDLVHPMRLLRDRFDIANDAEVTIEIDPRVLAPEMLTALGVSGINRASLGVQTFDPVVQRSINRVQSVECTAASVAGLRRAGVARINFDLIYGLPHQTIGSCVETVTAALAMRPDRLAVFGYAHVPGFKKHQRLIDEAALPDGEARIEQAAAIADMLLAAGYVQIGLDHFALPDDELARAQAEGRLRRNFQGYTSDSCDTLIGFGASAIGRTENGYVQNDVGIRNYSDLVAAGRFATARGYHLTHEDRVRGAIIERLMCDFEADIAGICAERGFDPAALLQGNERLSHLLDEGLAEMDAGILRMRPGHRFLVRMAAAAFDAYLEQSPRMHSKAA
jgi:oxygen-independent coproporphyrinogen-3 oxidase